MQTHGSAGQTPQHFRAFALEASTFLCMVGLCHPQNVIKADTTSKGFKWLKRVWTLQHC